MKVRHDPDADAVYVVLRDEPTAFTYSVDEDRIIDYTADREPRGLEVLNVGLGIKLSGLPLPTLLIAQELRSAGLAVLDVAQESGRVSVAAQTTTGMGQPMDANLLTQHGALGAQSPRQAELTGIA